MSQWQKRANFGAHTSLEAHASPHTSLGEQTSAYNRAHTILGTQTSAHTNAHFSFGAQTSSHTSLGVHMSSQLGGCVCSTFLW